MSLQNILLKIIYNIVEQQIITSDMQQRQNFKCWADVMN